MCPGLSSGCFGGSGFLIGIIETSDASEVVAWEDCSWSALGVFEASWIWGSTPFSETVFSVVWASSWPDSENDVKNYSNTISTLT